MPKSIKNIMPGASLKVPGLGAKRTSGPAVSRKPFKKVGPATGGRKK